MKKIGRQVLMLKTAPGNPRNGEGAFIRLTDGRILFAYTRFCDGDKWEDHSKAVLAAVESADEGETWSDPRTILTPQEDEVNLMCASLLRMENGDIGLIYGVKYAENGAIKMRVMLRRSADEGRTWSEARVCADEHCYLVLENDRAVRLASGRIVIPLNRHGSDGNHIAPGTACFYFSDDDGRTWQVGGELRCPTASAAGLQETGLFEHDDGGHGLLPHRSRLPVRSALARRRPDVDRAGSRAGFRLPLLPHVHEISARTYRSHTEPRSARRRPRGRARLGPHAARAPDKRRRFCHGARALLSRRRREQRVLLHRRFRRIGLLSRRVLPLGRRRMPSRLRKNPESRL